LHDVLESIAVLRERADIIYEDENGVRHQVRSRIKDVFSRNKEEFIVLEDDTQIRLDRLKMVNETWFGTQC
jgi:transcriptional antiterminator Rof (Rho-off)